MIHVPNIYPPELEPKRTTESPTMLSYLDGKYHTTIVDKRDNFGINIVNFYIYAVIFPLNLLMECTFHSQ